MYGLYNEHKQPKIISLQWSWIMHRASATWHRHYDNNCLLCTKLYELSYSLYYDSIEQFSFTECQGGVWQLPVGKGSHQNVVSRGGTRPGESSQGWVTQGWAGGGFSQNTQPIITQLAHSRTHCNLFNYYTMTSEYTYSAKRRIHVDKVPNIIHCVGVVKFWHQPGTICQTYLNRGGGLVRVEGHWWGRCCGTGPRQAATRTRCRGRGGRSLHFRGIAVG